jgi:hypothetical protein
MTRTLPFLVFTTACLPDFPKRDFTEDPTGDYDGDGFTEIDGDCDDNEALAYPGADEVCDGIDNDCDGDADEDDALDAVTWYSDGDRDGFGTDAFVVMACAAPSEAYADNDDDCNDSVAEINPDALETCAAFDENCDGIINESEGNLETDTFYRDADGDGYGIDSDTVDGCDLPTGYAFDGGDCDDDDATRSPVAAEYCDEIDNDCDGFIDDDDSNLVADASWYVDLDEDGYGDPGGEVRYQCVAPAGFVRNDEDCEDGNDAISPDAVELCDTVDNDCDGLTDEADAADATVWYLDGDGDGYGNVDVPELACVPPATYVADGTDCDDGRPGVSPGATEDCDTFLDDDCDGDTNDIGADHCTVLYTDSDRDTFGFGEGICMCRGEAPVDVENDDDCDDTRGLVNPLAFEDCTTSYDDDCDGDDNDAGASYCSPWFYDGDGDGDGLDEYVCVCEGYSPYTADNGDDCDDTTALVWTGADEVCGDGVDNNCEGTIDGTEAVDGIWWYRDGDGDGFGTDVAAIQTCDLSAEGYVTEPGDCNDGRDDIHPDATESCFTAFDDNCDGSDNDPGDTAETGPIGGLEHFLDTDGDGYGLASDSMWACDDADLYRTRITGDCDDHEPGANPAMAETCATEFDDNCDGDDNDLGAVDCTTLFYDWDGDEYGIADSECRCISVGAYTAELAGDCVDTDESINPGTESCGLSGEITMEMANAVVSGSSTPLKTRSAGDVNGDGFDDLMVQRSNLAVPVDGALIPFAGAVHIWHGPPPAAMNSDLFSGVVEGPDASVVGAAPAEQVGRSTNFRDAMRLHGEFDGDGYGDLLVVYVPEPPISGGTYINAVPIFGPLEGIHSVSEWDPLFWATDQEAFSLGILPDVTNDGLDEVYRATDSLNFYWSELTGETMGGGDLLVGDAYRDQALAVSGDWTGDGIADLAVLERDSTPTLYLHDTAPVAGSDPEEWAVSPAVAVHESLGESGDSVLQNLFFGHADADGHLDLMVVVGGKSIYDPALGVLPVAGMTYIIKGPLGGYPEGELIAHAETVIRGDGGDNMGASAVFSDINGDGLNDPLLAKSSSTYSEASRTVLFYSPLPSGTLTAADANGRFTLNGPRDVGDLNGDGRTDLVFGNTYLFYGQPTE